MGQLPIRYRHERGSTRMPAWITLRNFLWLLALVLYGCGEPTLTVDSTPATTESASVVITGTATPAKDTTISSVIARTSAGDKPATLNGTRFSVEVPLALGSNAITIIATATASGQTATSQASVSIKRTSLPKLNNIQPLEGSVLSTSTTTISGEVRTAWPVASVQFYLNNSLKTLTQTSPGVYSFNVSGVTLAVGANAIALRATTPDGADTRTLNLTYKIPQDTTPPQLAVANPPNQAVEATTITVSGSVSDPVQTGSGIASVKITSDRTGATEYGAQLQGSTYQAAVPLSLGQNTLTVTATDLSGNKTSATLIVKRISLPHLQSLQPTDGTTVKIASINIGGEVKTDWTLPDVRLYCNDIVTTLTTTSAGVYQFQIPNLSLKVGDNSVVLRATTPDGADSRTMHFTYSPDPDTTAPTLAIDNANNASMETSTLLITGTVDDPQQYGSGIASIKIVSSRTGSTEYAVALQANRYQATVPLSLGQNVFTVTAADLAGNKTSANLTVTRASLPHLQTLQPANGTEIKAATTALSGEVRTEWPQANVHAFINDVETPLTLRSTGVYQFQQNNAALQVGENHFVLRATTPDGADTQSLTLVRIVDPDTTPPQLRVDNADNQSLEVATLTVTGNVSDPEQYGSGVASVMITSDRDASATYNATLAGEHFQVEVPLLLGQNVLTVHAKDLQGNTATSTLKVKRISPPRWQSVQPDDNTTFTTPAASLSGQFKTEWPATDVQLKLNGAPQSFAAAGAGLYQFQVNDLALQLGSNAYALEATTPDGTDTRTIHLIYQPLPDTTPPQLQVDTADNQLTASSTIVITGRATDPEQYYSGMASVTVHSDRYVDTPFSALLSADRFGAEIPLMVGVNHLTITAEDASGNQSQAMRTIQRTSRPELINVLPLDGSVITSDHVTLSGEIRTLQPLAVIKVAINEWQLTPSATPTPGVYQFESANIPLQLDANRFVVQVKTPDGDVEKSITLIHRPENADAIPAPELSVIAPLANAMLRESSFTMKAHVLSHGGPVKVTINGSPYNASVADPSDYYVESMVSFAEGQETAKITLVAKDTLGKTSTLVVPYQRDATAPVLQVLNSLAPVPAVNPVMDSPYAISGLVSDSHLASLTLNDQPVKVQPTASVGHYTFSFGVQLAPGQENSMVLVARDLSGNKTTLAYVLKSQAEVGLTPLLPEEGAEYLSQGAVIPVQVAARLVGLSDGTLARVSVNGAAPLNLTVSGELAGGDISLPPQPGNVTLVYEAVTSDGRIVASSTRTVKVTGEADVKVALLRHEPLDNEANVEPNKPIELYFNKAIDPQKLQVSVRETLHGKTYVNLDAPGVDFLHAKGYQLQDVHRDLESVPAALSLMPGNEAAAISPERHFGFNATVFVEVNYDHQSLGHFQYTVRRLPTFLIGGVIDQFSQPLAGIQVSLPELGRSTTTNTDGSFAFGFQEKPGNELPGGKYQLLVNPDLATPGYGMQIRSVNLQEGRRNEVGRIRLPELTRDAAFEFVASKGKSTLAGGGLVIDASSATLLFKQGRQEGQLHVQFTPVEETGTPFMPGVLPQWLYALQPRGVKVEGSLGVRIHMPMIDQSYDYLPEGTQWVLLVGYNPAHEIIEPVGVGHIEEHSVVGTAAYASLDFMGYALLAPEYQQKLQDVAEGKRTLQQLMSELQ